MCTKWDKIKISVVSLLNHTGCILVVHLIIAFLIITKVGFFHSACGGNWTATTFEGQHLKLEEELCCKFNDGVSSWFRCDGSPYRGTCEEDPTDVVKIQYLCAYFATNLDAIVFSGEARSKAPEEEGTKYGPHCHSKYVQKLLGLLVGLSTFVNYYN